MCGVCCGHDACPSVLGSLLVLWVPRVKRRPSVDVQSLGENHARFLRASSGDAACTIYLIGGVIPVSVHRGQVGDESPTRALYQQCWRMQMSMSFLKPLLVHFHIPSPTSLTRVAPYYDVPVCASSSSSQWSVQHAWCSCSRLVLRSRYFVVVLF